MGILSRDELVALAAGASTGIIADVVLFPLDYFKTNAQGNTTASGSAPKVVTHEAAATSSSRPSVPRTPVPCRPISSSRRVYNAGDVVARRGTSMRFRSCYSGIAALAMGSMPSSAGFFVVYEVAKENLRRRGVEASQLSTHVLGAAIAESSACVIRNPFEVVKQQVQLGLHSSTAAGFNAVWRHEGLRGFFVGMGTSMLRDVPFAALQISLWEWIKLKALGENPPSTHFSAAVSGAAGVVAGAVAAVVTTPMDVAKTRLMTQKPGARQYRGFFHCLSTMYWTEGLPSLFLGVKMRCLWVALGGGIFLGGYDAFKSWYLQLLEGHYPSRKEVCRDCCQLEGSALCFPVSSTTSS